jgi:hypothetical protein
MRIRIRDLLGPGSQIQYKMEKFRSEIRNKHPGSATLWKAIVLPLLWVRLAAKAFIQLGLKPHHAVNILGFNAPEWSIRHTPLLPLLESVNFQKK